MLPRVIVPRPRACGLLLGLALGLACQISNDDHCVHKAVEADAWCATQDPARPFCSPCAAPEHGCVATRPDLADCPAYTPDTPATTGEASSTSVTTSD